MSVLGGGPMLLISLYWAGLECDESCDDRSSLWRDDPGAWQWQAQLGLAVVSVAAAFVGTALLFRRRMSAGLVTFGGGAFGALMWAAWML